MVAKNSYRYKSSIQYRYNGFENEAHINLRNKIFRCKIQTLVEGPNISEPKEKVDELSGSEITKERMDRAYRKLKRNN